MENIKENSVKPISTKERIKELDLVRGFALFGVLLVNIAMINTTLFTKFVSAAPLSKPLELDGILNRMAALFIQVFAEGKFYTIFSFLFGLGFYIFMDRAAKKHPKSNRLFLRRSFFLLLFGILHFSLVWYGDILHVYGIIGFILLLFKNSSLKTVKIWIIILLILSTFIYSSFAFLNALASHLMGDEFIAQQTVPMYEQMYESIEVYESGSFIDIVSYRLKYEAGPTFSNLIFIIPKILGMFLIGLYVGKKGILKNIQENLPYISSVWVKTGIIGFLATVIYSLMKYNLIPVSSLISAPTVKISEEVATVFLSLFYITSLVLLWQKPRFKKFLTPLTYMGQMALTNYLVQCILASFIFYGYGLGLLNKIGVATGVLITFIIYGIQLIYSKPWLEKYKYGPFEWIWRKLTYGGSL